MAPIARSDSRLQGALDGFIVEGIKTTVALQKTIFADPNFCREFRHSFSGALGGSGQIALFPSLYAIVDASLTEDRFRLPASWRAAGVKLIQLRDKRSTARHFFSWRRKCARYCCHWACIFPLVNDRADIAAMVGASGVHVGQDDLPVEDAPKFTNRLTG